MLIRPRRNRRSEAIRKMVQEARLDVSQLVYPLFLVDGKNIKDEVKSLPGDFRMSEDEVLKTIEGCVEKDLTNLAE